MTLKLTKNVVNSSVSSFDEWEQLMFPNDSERKQELALRSNPEEYGRQMADDVVRPLLAEMDRLFAPA